MKIIYKKEYYYNHKIYEEAYDLGMIDLKIEELNKKQVNLKKPNKYDLILLIFLIIIITSSIKYKIMIIFIIILITLELLYLNYRLTVLYEINLLAQSLEEKKKYYLEKQKNYYENLNKIKKEELRLKREKRNINNDIAFYNHELLKNNKNVRVNTSEKGNSYIKK